MRFFCRLFGLLCGLPFLVVGGLSMLLGVVLVGTAMCIARWSITEGDHDFRRFMCNMVEGL